MTVCQKISSVLILHIFFSFWYSYFSQTVEHFAKSCRGFAKFNVCLFTLVIQKIQAHPAVKILVCIRDFSKTTC